MNNEQMTTAECPAQIAGKPNVGRSGCSECQNPKVLCKGLCAACYSKNLRRTDKWKEYTRIYNSTLGKEANKRYYEKHKIIKPPKPEKVNCQCGVMSIAKGFCMNCYQKNHIKKNKPWTNRGIVDKQTDDIAFQKVLNEVRKGITIRQACKKLNINTNYLYNVMSPVQKAELIAYKIIGVSDFDYNEDSDM